jgi:hypothetical protein
MPETERPIHGGTQNVLTADPVAKPLTAYPCPECDGPTRVLTTRMRERHGNPYAFRQRVCETCGEKFSTHELTTTRVHALHAAAEAFVVQMAPTDETTAA